MRTAHENFVDNEDVVNDLGEQAVIFKKDLAEYASALSSAVSNQGKLISIERFGRNALLLGWMEALESVNLAFDLSCYEELECEEAGELSVFQAFICYKGIECEIGAKELFDYACSKYLDYSLAEYKGHDAKIVFENRRKSLIEGYYLEFPRLHTKARISLWTHNSDDTCIIAYHNNNGDASVSFHDVSQKEELLESMHNAIEEAQSSENVIITEMK